MLALLTAGVLCAGVLACGDAQRDSSARTKPAAETIDGIPSTQKGGRQDRDNDSDHNDDDGMMIYYGHPATASQRQTLIALVSRYYAAAAAADGAKACALLVPFVAESVAETYGHDPQSRGKTCTAVMSKVFEHRRRLLTAESATLKGVDARVDGRTALTIIDFAALPEVRQITERLVDGRWRMLYPLDHIVE